MKDLGHGFSAGGGVTISACCASLSNLVTLPSCLIADLAATHARPPRCLDTTRYHAYDRAMVAGERNEAHVTWRHRSIEEKELILQKEINQVVETAEGIVFMGLAYSPGDIGAAVGNLYRLAPGGSSGDQAIPILSTNDALRVLWTSPAGHLWVGSADGRVGTTAPTGWAVPSGDLEYEVLNGGPAWTVSALPRDRSKGLPPNVTALWGCADDDVHVGARGGHMYHWDGEHWAQTRDGDGTAAQTIRTIRGHASDDVYAVGAVDTLLHFDGQQWSNLPIPGTPTEGESLGGIALLPEKTVMICGSGVQGRLLHGSAAGFAEFGRYAMPLNDVAALGDRLLFAVWNGVAELFGRDVRIVKDNFKTAGAFEGRGRVFFTEPAAPRMQYIVHDPAKEMTPWTRSKF